MIESGTQITGQKLEVSSGGPMREGIAYEFVYSVTKLPFPGFLEQLRGFIMSMWTSLMGRFKGLRVVYWTLTDNEFIWQGRGKSASIWEEVALATVAVACQGILLFAGIAMSLKSIFEFTSEFPEPVKKGFLWLALAGIGGLGLLLFSLGRKST